MTVSKTNTKKTTTKTTKVNKILKSKKPVMVLFYMIGCSHCDALHPTWKEVEKTYKNNKAIETAEVEFGDLALFPDDIRKNIAGFPTIQVLKNGKVVSEYAGGRTKESIEEFANKFAENAKDNTSTTNVIEGGNKTKDKDTKNNKETKVAKRKNI